MRGGNSRKRICASIAQRRLAVHQAGAIASTAGAVPSAAGPGKSGIYKGAPGVDTRHPGATNAAHGTSGPPGVHQNSFFIQKLKSSIEIDQVFR